MTPVSRRGRRISAATLGEVKLLVRDIGKVTRAPHADPINTTVKLVASVAPGTRSWTDSTRVPLVAYRYQMAAVNLVGEGVHTSSCTHAMPRTSALSVLLPCT